MYNWCWWGCHWICRYLPKNQTTGQIRAETTEAEISRPKTLNPIMKPQKSPCMGNAHNFQTPSAVCSTDILSSSSNNTDNITKTTWSLATGFTQRTVFKCFCRLHSLIWIQLVNTLQFLLTTLISWTHFKAAIYYSLSRSRMTDRTCKHYGMWHRVSTLWAVL